MPRTSYCEVVLTWEPAHAQQDAPSASASATSPAAPQRRTLLISRSQVNNTRVWSQWTELLKLQGWVVEEIKFQEEPEPQEGAEQGNAEPDADDIECLLLCFGPIPQKVRRTSERTCSLCRMSGGLRY